MSLLSLNYNIRGDHITATHIDCVKSGVKSLTILGIERGTIFLFIKSNCTTGKSLHSNESSDGILYSFFLIKTSKKPVHIS